MPAPPPERVVLSTDTEAQWVPFELTPGNQIQFHMTIDGRPIVAILDTGFSMSSISRRFASREGLKIGGGGQGLGVGGSVAMGLVNGRTLTIGGLTRTGGQLGVLDLPSGATGNGGTVDAVVGGDLLRRYALDIDFTARRFRLLPSGRLPFAGQTAPLSLALGYQLYVSEMTIDGTRLRPVIVDTGDGATITMSDEAWKSIGGTKPATTTTISYSIAGPVTSELTVLPAVRVGETMVREAEARIEPGRGFSAQMGAAGRIGVGYLQRYRVLLDPGAGRMVLAASSDVDRPPLRSTSGLLLGFYNDRLRVLHVMRGGPAAAAGGWQAGDQICSVDGQAIDADYANEPISMWSVADPGRVVRLGMCDGGERRLTLERFY
ncbi:MAG: retropepsin-like aspartic protease [Sphingomonas sp.]|uniref:retropepsin-like aspartic protease n=1 Tax=Sphingomonas sp. TaxID=28214 RepID=UPI003F80F700